MQASNNLEGYRCWLCDSNTADSSSLDKVVGVEVAHNLLFIKVGLCLGCAVWSIPEKYSTGTPGWRLQPLRNANGERLHQALVNGYAIRVIFFKKK